MNLQESVNFVKEVGKQLVELQHFDWNLFAVMYFLIKNLDILLLLNLNNGDNHLMRPIYTMKLLLTDNSRITNRKELLMYLFKTYLNFATIVVNCRRF